MRRPSTASAFDIPKDFLWEDFRRHLDLLAQKGYVTETGALTEDGIWASQLRVDQPELVEALGRDAHGIGRDFLLVRALPQDRRAAFRGNHRVSGILDRKSVV